MHTPHHRHLQEFLQARLPGATHRAPGDTETSVKPTVGELWQGEGSSLGALMLLLVSGWFHGDTDSLG